MTDVVLRGDMNAVLRDLDRVNGPIKDRAAKRALSKVGSQLRTRVARQYARDYNVPVRAARDRVHWRRILGGKAVRFTVLTLRILARHLGKPRQLRRGARAGRHLFSGAFVATMPSSGKVLVMKRRGSSRLPIDERGVPMIGAKATADQFVRRIGPRIFKKEFERQLRLGLRRKFG